MADKDMTIHARHIVQALEYAPPGRGHRADIYGLTLNSLRDSAGALLTGATTPLVEISSAQLRATFATGVTVATAHIRVPREFAQARMSSDKSRELVLEVVAAVAGSTDSPTLTVTAVAQGKSGAAKATYTAAAVTISGTTRTTYRIPLSELLASSGSLRIKPGDALTLTFTLGTHGTDAVYFYDLGAYMRANRNWTNVASRNSSTGGEQD